VGTGFVLSVIQPPKGEAEYGKATVSEPHADRGKLFTLAYWAIRKRDGWLHPEVANRSAEPILSMAVGEEVVEAHTGLRFRIDSAENAPHPCPCEDGCGRLVLPDQHAYADAEDAYCLGCFTWDRNTPACLPANSAHARQI
jgi:hypothetical protein